jgi:predicted DNA-binding transcriptional regulator AlpA
MPVLVSDPPPVPERVNAANQSQGPPRLLGKHEVCAIANVSFPTVWAWMRAGSFPRSRVVGGKSMWFSTEVSDWLAALPIRPLKGDTEAA